MRESPESLPEAELISNLAVETVAGDAEGTAARRPSLWHHADYLKVWFASTISLAGSQVSQFAIPVIAALVLRATVFEVALLGTFEMLPFILFTLPAGAWLDRVRRRPVLIAGDFGRAAALVSIPIAYALGVLTIWQLYAVGLTTGFLTVLFDVADQSYLPVLLDPEDLVEGNAKLQIPASAAQIVGPGFAGGLIGIVAAPFAIFIDAASFVASGSLISLIRKQETKPERKLRSDGTRTSLRQEIAEGLRYVLGSRYLRMIAGSTGTFNLGSSMAFAVFPVFAYVELGLSPALVGTAFSLGSLGVLLGAFLAVPVARHLGVGPTIILSSAIDGPAMIILAFLPSDPLGAGAILAASMGLGGICGVIYNVNQVSFRQAITPLDMQGRMNATMRFIVWGTMPIGSVMGGILATFLPLRTTILIAGTISAVSFLWVLLSPVRSLRTIPKAAGTVAASD
ncbi:MAG: MFS transporter [Candidatus Limnocylindrales bacterium]|jgi:MFS family permease